MAGGRIFSQRCGYGVHALAFIAKKPAGELTTLPEVAGWMKTIWPEFSETYLGAVVQRLARGRLLRSHRGIAGGYSLGRAATAMTLREVVELLDGIAWEPDRCGLSMAGACSAKGRCSIQRKLSQVERSFFESLEKITIADLASQVVVARQSAAPG